MTVLSGALACGCYGEADVMVEGEAGDADAAVRLSRLHQPHVVSLDVARPGRSGVEARGCKNSAGPRSFLGELVPVP